MSGFELRRRRGGTALDLNREGLIFSEDLVDTPVCGQRRVRHRNTNKAYIHVEGITMTLAQALKT